MTGETTSCEGFKKGKKEILIEKHKYTEKYNQLKLVRFEERNKELEEQYLQLREDKADVVAFLKRTLQQRTDTIHELTDRLEGMKVAHFCFHICAFLFFNFFEFLI